MIRTAPSTNGHEQLADAGSIVLDAEFASLWIQAAPMSGG